MQCKTVNDLDRATIKYHCKPNSDLLQAGKLLRRSCDARSRRKNRERILGSIRHLACKFIHRNIILRPKSIYSGHSRCIGHSTNANWTTRANPHPNLFPAASKHNSHRKTNIRAAHINQDNQRMSPDPSGAIQWADFGPQRRRLAQQQSDRASERRGFVFVLAQDLGLGSGAALIWPPSDENN